MLRGFVASTDLGGHPFANPRAIPPLEFLPATSEGRPNTEAPGVLIRSIPSRQEIRNPDPALVWYLCTVCRLLHYPVPAPLV